MITHANHSDCRAIAELAMIAGEGIPAYFWAKSQQRGEDICDVGARSASSETENFSYRNAWLACLDDQTAGMLLAYRLPDAAHADDPAEYPALVRPLVELENRVPKSYYINMLATYPKYRNRGLGAALMAEAERQAADRGCRLLSVQVFDENMGALRFYQRLGYTVVDQREVVRHECFRYTGRVLLLTKRVGAPSSSYET